MGPLHLWIQHPNHQWKLSWKNGDDWLDTTVRFQPGAHQMPIPESAQHMTCVFGSTTKSELIFSPALSDRSVIVRLHEPLKVLPDEDIQLYSVSPLWLRVEMAEPNKLVHEIPLYRLSDSWFGPVTSAGELTYALPLSATTRSTHLNLHDVPLRLHCAITPVKIRNSGTDALRIDRLNLPLNRLSLFYSPRSGFWTNQITLERSDDSEMAVMKLDRQPPADANPTQFITGPRMKTEGTHPVIRAFSAIFRERNSGERGSDQRNST